MMMRFLAARKAKAAAQAATAGEADSAWISRRSIAHFAADRILLDHPLRPSRTGGRGLLAALVALMISGPIDSVAKPASVAGRVSRGAKVTQQSTQPRFDAGLSYEEWLNKQYDISINKLAANISPAGAARGGVVASPSKNDPPYFYVWIRDAALVMDVVLNQYVGRTGEDKAQWGQMLRDYVDFSRENQLTWTLSGLGEPKFNADGSAFNEPWGRPQNDGPALRALTLSRYAQVLLQEGEEDYVREVLYRAELPADTVIKADLEYTAHHWRDKSFDLWEETFGDHFYTRMSQLAALREGAVLADTLGDGGAAAFYRGEAREIEKSLQNFWSEQKGIIRVTLNQAGGLQGKDSEIDVAVVLAALHMGFTSGQFTIADDRILATAQRIEESFKGLYAINNTSRFPDLGTAIGRYPECRYSGQANIFEGNPWVLSTAALAELNYRLATALRSFASFEVTNRNIGFVRANAGKALAGKQISVGMRLAKNSPEMKAFINSLIERGDAFMRRVRMHANPDGSLSEQIDRNSGFMVSARDLTWSYASYITAFLARP